jgi:hypothetical protein
MRCFQRQQSVYILSLALQTSDISRELLNLVFDRLHGHVLHGSQTLSIYRWVTGLFCSGTCQAANSASCEPTRVDDSHIESQALVVQQHCKVVPAGQAPVCQLQTGTHVHTRLRADLDTVHCRLACCIGSVIMHLEHTSIPATLQSRAIVEPLQLTVQCCRICCGCTVVLCQTLALLCLLMHHVLCSSCRFCCHMLVQEVRATALDVLEHGTPGLASQSSEQL